MSAEHRTCISSCVFFSPANNDLKHSQHAFSLFKESLSNIQQSLTKLLRILVKFFLIASRGFKTTTFSIKSSYSRKLIMQMSKVQWLSFLYLKNTWLTKNFQQMVWNQWTLTGKNNNNNNNQKTRNNLGTDLTTLKKFNLKWIKDLTAKHKIVKL